MSLFQDKRFFCKNYYSDNFDNGPENLLQKKKKINQDLACTEQNKKKPDFFYIPDARRMLFNY